MNFQYGKVFEKVLIFYFKIVSIFVLQFFLMAKDRYHYLVKEALIKDGWIITHDPYTLRDWDPDWEIDLGAEKIIAAEKENEKIAVEVKLFLELSFAYEFHKALGQYLNYRASLSELEKERTLFLAIPLNIWEIEFQRKGIKFSLEVYKVKIIDSNIESNSIEQWIL